MKNKRGIAMETLTWYIIAIFVLVFLVTGYLIIKNKGTGAIEFIKNLIRFGGS